MVEPALIEAARAVLPVGESAPASRPPDFAERRDQALRAVADPDLETVFIAVGGALTNTFHGHEGFARGWDEWVSAYESVVSSATELIEAGDKYLLLTEQCSRLPGSDNEMIQRSAVVVTFRNDRLARIEFHLEPDSAYEAAGIAADSG